MTEMVFHPQPAPLWVGAVSMLNLALLAALCALVLVGSWKLFRFLVKWRP